MNDPIIQACIFGAAISLAAAAISFYLWTEYRSERFLLFWTVAWTTGLIRWLIHYPAESNSVLRGIEGINISVTMFFTVLGSYDLLPNKPWRQRIVVMSTAALLLAYAVAANALRLPIQMGYVLFAAVVAFSGACMAVGFRVTRLPGYAFGAWTFLYQLVVLSVLLVQDSGEIANSIIVPLWNIPLMLSIVVIAFQRNKRRLIESEHTLQKIFETAPTPIVILRPPLGEIERANPVALEMLGITPDTAVSRTAVEYGVVADPQMRQDIYRELESGRRVHGREGVILRSGREERTVSINADRITLDSGDRYIYSFYDLTELRRAEADLRASAEQMRELYLRLANVEDDERRALHAELHDRVGANLAALRLELDVASSLLSRGEGPGATRHLNSAREVAAETIAMARDVMAELRPPALDDYGLVAALRTFAESQSLRLDLSIHVEGEDLVPRPGPQIEGALFRIAREAVINAARHAQATRVTVVASTGDGRVALTVEDDGVGFDPAAPAFGPDHWGLKSMRERAEAIGGTVRVDAGRGGGTRVTAHVPGQTG